MWNILRISLITIVTVFVATSIFGQENPNPFFWDFSPTDAIIPDYIDVNKPSDPVTVVTSFDGADTISAISPYVYGNALAVWIGSISGQNALISQTRKLAPTFIRYPGGSWADIFFWNGETQNVPDSLVDGTNGEKYSFDPHSGMGSRPTTVDQYYYFLDQVNSEGLITINYGYARYGTGEDPVADAAHLAADWVRYDDGLTLFWEIGNENSGPWEAGWQIDTTQNQDGQPQVITGELYGQHFNQIADSMRAAAEEIGVEIYIGAQILHYDGTNSWNVADRHWNEGVFREAGDAADFYVVHNYFGGFTPLGFLNTAQSTPGEMMDFIHQDMQEQGAPVKPIAVTEYNMDPVGADGEAARMSTINGMQAVISTCEFIKNKYSMVSRWLLANWESDGMFYQGNDSSIPDWNPRPAFFFMYYLQKYFGDYAINTTSDDDDVILYASLFGSKDAGVVIVNKGTDDQIVKIRPDDFGAGERYYVYSLSGLVLGDENPNFPRGVEVNGVGPISGSGRWGPLEDLTEIEADAYTIGDEIKIESPGRSVQFVLIEGGDNFISATDDETSGLPTHVILQKNYPNPFNPSTEISYSIPRKMQVTIQVYNMLGQVVKTLVDNSTQTTGDYKIRWNGTDNSGAKVGSGVYFCVLKTKTETESQKMILLK